MGTWDPWNNRVLIPLGFPFASYGGEEASYPEMPERVRQKSLCSFKGPRKEQHSKTENFYTITTALQPKITDKTVAHPYPMIAHAG